MGASYVEIHSAVKGYQEVLGKMHDLDVFASIVREAGLPSPTEAHVLDSIKLKREGFFADFSAMMETMSLETIGERVEKAL